MRAVIQRVDHASVTIGGKQRSIGKGYLVLVAATHADTLDDARYLSQKIINLRVMSDEDGKMNKSLKEVAGELLVVSQFTLYARTRKGNRPSFIDAAPPDLARMLYDELVRRLRETAIPIQTGDFAAYMRISLINDGPVTIILDSREKVGE